VICKTVLERICTKEENTILKASGFEVLLSHETDKYRRSRVEMRAPILQSSMYPN
jgi:hypothetical protein